MITIQPKQESKTVTLVADHSKASGKLGRHNLSFTTGAHKDRKKNARKYACRNKGRNRISDY
jgi:hypothetical protein